MALTNGEAIAAVSASGDGSSTLGTTPVDHFPLRLGRGLVDCVNDAARRAAVANGQTPGPDSQRQFITGALKLATQAVASPSADDQIRLSRAGW
jgi:hypothetical protein